MRHAHRFDKFQTGNTGGAAPLTQTLMSFICLPVKCSALMRAGGANNRRAVLVVVKHRNIHQLAQLLLNNEAIGCLNVFQINAAKARAHIFDRIDNLLRVLVSSFKVNRSTSAKRLNKTALPSMTGLEASAPKLPSPKMAVPLEITATILPRAVKSYEASAFSAMASTGTATPGE